MFKNWITENVRITNKNSITYRCRKKRMHMFEKFFEENVLNSGVKKQTILDLGGTLSFWQSMDFKYIDRVSITLLNVERVEIPDFVNNISSIAGDARNLNQYADKQFDLVFSNSVIEHVGNFENQRQMAKEMMRVGKHFYIQTPNRYFIMEPHFLFPFFQHLPVKVKAYLIKNHQLGNYSKAKTDAEAMEIARSIRLMTKRELKELFPDAKIWNERLFFMIKSFSLYN